MIGLSGSRSGYLSQLCSAISTLQSCQHMHTEQPYVSKCGSFYLPTARILSFSNCSGCCTKSQKTPPLRSTCWALKLSPYYIQVLSTGYCPARGSSTQEALFCSQSPPLFPPSSTQYPPLPKADNQPCWIPAWVGGWSKYNVTQRQKWREVLLVSPAGTQNLFFHRIHVTDADLLLRFKNSRSI